MPASCVSASGAHISHAIASRMADAMCYSRAAKSLFQPGKAIRGGVPVIFPVVWPQGRPTPTPPRRCTALCAPAIGPSPTSDKAEWWRRFAFALELGSSSDATRNSGPARSLPSAYVVTIGLKRSTWLWKCKTDPAKDAFTFRRSACTYVSHRRRRQQGSDRRAGGPRVPGQNRQNAPQDPGCLKPITITGETDRVYLNSPDPVASSPIHKLGRRLSVIKEVLAKHRPLEPVDRQGQSHGRFRRRRMAGDAVCRDSQRRRECGFTLAAGKTHRMSASISRSTGTTKQWKCRVGIVVRCQCAEFPPSYS